MREAWLYVDMQTCACGSDEFRPSHELHRHGDVMVARFEGQCPDCGTRRTLDIEFPTFESPLPAFGGAQSSTLIDPGEFLWVSDQAAARVPIAVGDLTAAQRAAAVSSLEYAIAALEEVAKFIPAGSDAVPPAYFVSELGQAIHHAEPQRFTATEIRDRIASYRSGLAELGSLAGRHTS